MRDRIETETDRVKSEFKPPLVAEIETRTDEIKGTLLEDDADELDIETDVEAPTQV